MYVHLRLQDGYQALGQDSPGNVELLLHNGLDALLIEVLDHRALLGAKDASSDSPIQQGIQRRHVLHQLHAILLLGQTLVNLKDGHHLLHLPKELRRGHAADLPVHGRLEEDRSHDAGAIELRVRDDAAAHLVHPVHHLHLALVGRVFNPIEPQSLWRAATTLIQSRNETVLAGHLCKLTLPIRGCHREQRKLLSLAVRMFE
mmetsp:Transcript_72296/g.190625  ORF Transcript_72296/g.190625 Transcript_72296/m.190625 type:complete len:202 (+) Transcript_72296:200-805(+)